ncbi:MAG: SAM-dependent methyltransferase [Opitutaceae bacterium]|nr:SAM-dependent methyltransferase [Opitutaceae bacterium]
MSPRRAAVESARAERCGQLRVDLARLLPAAAQSTRRILEIGSGHGHFLEAYASAHPTDFCLGIDYCAERSRRAARKQQRHEHGNLHFLRAEVWEFLDSLPLGLRFDRVFILFPDPWPKRRHRKYRLVSERFLDRLAPCVAPDAALYLRTDAAAYFAEAEEVIAAHVGWRLAPEAPWPFEQPTVFQSKARSFQSLVALSVNSAR